MTQPSLLDVPTPRAHRRVRDTSIASYAEGRERLTGRKADVLRWLAAHWNFTQASPTSAELAVWKQSTQRFSHQDDDDWVMREHAEVFRLHVRKGLSDLQTKGLVETVERRRCSVTAMECRTWRVKQR